MAVTSTQVLGEAMKLSVRERVRLAEKLLESADAEGYEDDSEAAIHAAWGEELQQRSRELKDGSVRGLSIEEARRIVASDPADDDRCSSSIRRQPRRPALHVFATPPRSCCRTSIHGGIRSSHRTWAGRK